MSDIDKALALFESGSPREWPICALFSDDPYNLCFMSKNGQSKFLDRDCYSPNDAENPKHRCDDCKKPLHSALCAPSHSEDGSKLMCKLCVEQTMDIDDVIAMATAAAATTGCGGSRKKLAATTTTPPAAAHKKEKKKKTVCELYKPPLVKFMKRNIH
jgi:hypothetical protein